MKVDAEETKAKGGGYILHAHEEGHPRHAPLVNEYRPELGMRQLYDEESKTLSYLIWDKKTEDAIIIDPVRDQVARDLVVSTNLHLRFAINTHVHEDHVSGTKALKKKVKGLRSVISKDSCAEADDYIEDGDEIHFGTRFISAIATPGHTNGCMSFLLDDGKDPAGAHPTLRRPRPEDRRPPRPAGGVSAGGTKASKSGIAHNVGLLTGPLSRASDELGIAQAFLAQQLRSRFVLWLTLQNDGFYRGRSVSERLIAARIGERMLHGGTDRAAPLNGMWPLVCHEVGLSYEQEERIRHVQHAILANAPLWVTRHTARAAHGAMEGVREILGGARRAAQRRERGLMEALWPEQKVKFL